jgi:demethylmenaquinone methyltransferase/2-methoxy-6-polyprenyl-1,4-benzoquinol methylase
MDGGGSKKAEGAETLDAVNSEASGGSDQDPVFVRRAFSAIADRYVLTNHVLSLGIDVLWRRRVARLVAEVGARKILDIATGSGDLAATIEKRVEGAEVVGADFCAPMLQHARRRGLRSLAVADGLQLPFADASFDAVTVGYGLRNMASWDAAMVEFLRVLLPGGRLVVLDFSLPSNRLIRGPYRFYLHRVLPKIGGWLAGDRGPYEYLGDSIERFPSGDAMCDRLRGNGFAEPIAEALWGGISSIYVATKGGTRRAAAPEIEVDR